MGNEYYHAFAVGFNWWYVALPVFMVWNFLIGTRYYRIYKRRICPKFKKKWRKPFRWLNAGVATIVVIIMAFVESSNGLIQMFDNHLTAYDSPAWSLILAGFAMGAFALLVYGLNDLAFRFGAAIQHMRLEIVLEKRAALRAKV